MKISLFSKYSSYLNALFNIIPYLFTFLQISDSYAFYAYFIILILLY